MDILADSAGDMAIVGGEISFVSGQDAIGQHIAFRVRTFLNESRYNSDGTPWTQIIFRPNTPRKSAEFILEQRIVGTPGVTGCSLETPVVDAETRGATVTGTAITIDGEVSFTVSVGTGVQG